MFFDPSKTRQIAKIRDMGVSKTFQHTHIKIEMPNPSPEPSASFNAPNLNLQDVNVLQTFKNQDRGKKILEPSCIEVQLHIHIKSRYRNPSQKVTVSQHPKSRLKGHGFSLHLQKSRQKVNILDRCVSQTCDHIQI